MDNFALHEISHLTASSVSAKDLLIVKEFENEKIISHSKGLLNTLTKVVTGCLRTTKDAKLVVFS